MPFCHGAHALQQKSARGPRRLVAERAQPLARAKIPKRAIPKRAAEMRLASDCGATSARFVMAAHAAAARHAAAAVRLCVRPNPPPHVQPAAPYKHNAMRRRHGCAAIACSGVWLEEGGVFFSRLRIVKQS